MLDAARALGRRIVIVFQPHRYTRTAALMDEFGPAMAGASHIVLTDIYPAGEDRIAGVSAEALARSVRQAVSALPSAALGESFSFWFTRPAHGSDRAARPALRRIAW